MEALPCASAERIARRSVQRALALGLLAMFGALRTQGQAPAAEPFSTAGDSPGTTMTLHVYAAHVQMPAMILTAGLQPIPSLAADRFRIRLDGGVPFAPSAVRLEGEDPIALSVLIDAGGAQERLMPQLATALVHLRTVALHPKDTLLLYAVDCNTVRYSTVVPLTAAGVEHALHALLSSLDLHRGSTLPACGNSLRLWDTFATMIEALDRHPGRRVMLAFTAGQDGGSRNAWSALTSYAAARSVAVFAMAAGAANRPHGSESPLWNVCARTGGLLLLVNPRELPQRLDALVDVIRGRYILDFPRSNRLAGGNHVIDLQVLNAPRTVVRLTGLSVPMLDEKLRDDPSTVPYLEAEKPGIGTRRPLSPGGPPK